jgi:hypothetical protein
VPDHLRCDPLVVDEDESRCIELGLLSLEGSASSSNVRTILLGSAQCFFESDIVTVVKAPDRPNAGFMLLLRAQSCVNFL